MEQLATKLTTETFLPSDWWRTLKRFIKPNNSSSYIPPLKTNDDILDDNKDKANLLNTYFQTQTQINESNVDTPFANFDQDRAKLHTIVITPLEVKSVLKTLKLGKASGPDQVNNRILKELCNELATPFCNLFNISLNVSKIPTQWKMAYVCAIFKKNDPSDVLNYRPVSLLSTIEKVFEKIIHKHVFNFFKQNNIITFFQSGFVPNDSTVNQLVAMYNAFCQALDEGK